MTSRFNQIFHGDMDTLFEILSGDSEPLDSGEIQAALSNVVKHVARLEMAWNAEHPDRPL